MPPKENLALAMIDDQWPATFDAWLQEWQQGHAEGLEHIFARLYEELKGAARRCLRGEAPNHTLQTTELVHELFLRLTKNNPPNFDSPQQFVFFTTGLMRLILVDYARRKLAQKRGGRKHDLPLEEAFIGADKRGLDPMSLLEMEEMVEALSKVDSRQSKILVLRTLLGLNHAEISQTLKCSERTVYREWNLIKHWVAAFKQQMSKSEWSHG